MKARFNYRIYPTPTQARALAQLFGCVRTVWNDSLSLCRMSRKLPKVQELQKLFITLSKKTQDRGWLKDVSAIPLQQSIADLGVAYKNFFASLKSGRKVGYPKYKKRSNQQSARFTRGGFSFKQGKVYLAKIGLLKAKWSRQLPSTPSSVTVIKDCAERYFLSFVVEIKPVSKPASRESIGVDLGIRIFAALSNGEKVYAPDYSKLDRKIKRSQKRLARAVKGGNRREKLRLKIAKLHTRLADKRKDFLHKLSTRLVRDNGTVSLENLNVSGMVRNRKLARAISQCGWGQFRAMCEAKANKYCRDVRIIDRWSFTSQVCADCGYKWGKLDLSVREISCLGCGKLQHRDLNASRRIEQVGLGRSHDFKWTGRKCQTAGVAVSVEPSTHLVDENGQFCLPI